MGPSSPGGGADTFCPDAHRHRWAAAGLPGQGVPTHWGLGYRADFYLPPPQKGWGGRFFGPIIPHITEQVQTLHREICIFTEKKGGALGYWVLFCQFPDVI